MTNPEEQIVFIATLPPELSKARLKADLDQLLERQFDISIKEQPREEGSGQFNQIDSTTIEIILSILDTKAAAAAVQTTLGAVIGYVFARTGTKPKKKE